jgi:hypothetical protein
MDIFTGPVGSASVTQQIHDYSPGISANGLFWLVTAPSDAVQIDLDAGTASVRMIDVPVIDAHDLANSLTNGHGIANPPIPPVAPVPATVSFDIEWGNVMAERMSPTKPRTLRAIFCEQPRLSNGRRMGQGLTFSLRPRVLRAEFTLLSDMSGTGFSSTDQIRTMRAKCKETCATQFPGRKHFTDRRKSTTGLHRKRLSLLLACNVGGGFIEFGWSTP